MILKLKINSNSLNLDFNLIKYYQTSKEDYKSLFITVKAELSSLIFNLKKENCLINYLVGSIDHDNFVEFEGGILANPVRVHDTETGTTTTNTLLIK